MQHSSLRMSDMEVGSTRSRRGQHAEYSRTVDWTTRWEQRVTVRSELGWWGSPSMACVFARRSKQ